MAEQIISPGVFTRENDLSFLPQGIGAIGAAIVGPTQKGPAFIPTVVRSFAEFERRFGGLSSDTYVPQTVREYLRNAGAVTVVRVLAGGGMTYANGTNETIALVAGSAGSVAASYSSASIEIGDQGSSGQQLPTASAMELTINGVDFVPVVSASLHDNSNTERYVTIGSTLDGLGANFVLAINAAASLVNVSTSYDSSGNKLILSGSSAGVNTTAYTTSSVSGNTQKFFKLGGSASLSGGVAATDAAKVLLGTIWPSKSTTKPDLGLSTLANAGSDLTTNFNLILSGSAGASNITLGTAISGSVNPANSNYIFKKLGNTANNSKNGENTYTGTPGFTYLNFKDLQTGLLTTASNYTGYGILGSSSILSLVTQSGALTYSDGGTGKTPTEGYGWASTPYITSQFLDAQKNTTQLFRFHTLDHGTHLCHEYKISISNLREPGDIDNVEQYSTFSVLVRKTGDKDKAPNILEQFNNVNLNPDSPRYICRVIGDRYPQYNETLGKVELLGNYPNISNYIRVEASAQVDSKSTSPKLSPKGFKAVLNTISTSSFAVDFAFPSASYEGTQTIGGNYNSNAFLGFKFIDKAADNENFLQPLPDVSEANVSGDFNVENYSGHVDSGLYTGSLSASITSTGENGPTAGQLKFTIPFQGGQDGVRPDIITQTGEYISGTNLYGYDLSTTAKAGYKGYKKAIDVLANQDEYDINMLVTPGVIHSLHPLITQAGIDMCEARGDAFYVMDLNGVEDSVNQAVGHVGTLDTNYAAVYYPWVKVLDASINKPVLVPPSVIVPGAIAASDRIGAEWFAPAGLNRGILGNVLETKIRLNQAERDILYDNKINPIATFPQTGVCIWGQKTLQERSTALDRINVRRLLITLKKFIASSSKYLVFEQNTLQTRTRFLNIVNPYLESVQQQQGLYAFRVQMDESNNTPTVIDRNQLVGAIFLQPTKTAEYIVLDFNVMPTGATFDGGGGSGGY